MPTHAHTPTHPYTQAFPQTQVTVVYCVAAGALLPDPAAWPDIYRTQVAPLLLPEATEKKTGAQQQPATLGATDTIMQPVESAVNEKVNAGEDTAIEVKAEVKEEIKQEDGVGVEQGGDAVVGGDVVLQQDVGDAVAMETDATGGAVGVKTEGEEAPAVAGDATTPAATTPAATGDENATTDATNATDGTVAQGGEQHQHTTEEAPIPDPFLLLRCKRTKSCTWKAVVISLDGLLDYDQQVWCSFFFCCFCSYVCFCYICFCCYICYCWRRVFLSDVVFVSVRVVLQYQPTHLHVSITHLHVSITHLHVSNTHLHVSNTHLHVSITHLHVSITHLHVSITHTQDKEVGAFEVNLAAEAMHEMFLRDFGSVILARLEQQRCVCNVCIM